MEVMLYLEIQEGKLPMRNKMAEYGLQQNKHLAGTRVVVALAQGSITGR